MVTRLTSYQTTQTTQTAYAVRPDAPVGGVTGREAFKTRLMASALLFLLAAALASPLVRYGADVAGKGRAVVRAIVQVAAR